MLTQSWMSRKCSDPTGTRVLRSCVGYSAPQGIAKIAMLVHSARVGRAVRPGADAGLAGGAGSSAAGE